MCLEGAWDPQRPRRVPWAVGAFLLVRRPAWDAIGGFDPAQWLYAEDLDLGWRLARAGWATRYEPRARVRHHESAATGQAWGSDERTARWLRASSCSTLPGVVRPAAPWATWKAFARRHAGQLRVLQVDVDEHLATARTSACRACRRSSSSPTAPMGGGPSDLKALSIPQQQVLQNSGLVRASVVAPVERGQVLDVRTVAGVETAPRRTTSRISPSSAGEVVRRQREDVGVVPAPGAVE